MTNKSVPGIIIYSKGRTGGVIIIINGAEWRRITNLMANQRLRWWFNNKSSTRFYSHSIASHSITHEFFLFPFFHFSIFFSFFFLSQQFYLREEKRKITNKKCRSVYSRASWSSEWVSLQLARGDAEQVAGPDSRRRNHAANATSLLLRNRSLVVAG